MRSFTNAIDTVTNLITPTATYFWIQAMRLVEPLRMDVWEKCLNSLNIPSLLPLSFIQSLVLGLVRLILCFKGLCKPLDAPRMAKSPLLPALALPQRSYLQQRYPKAENRLKVEGLISDQ